MADLMIGQDGSNPPATLEDLHLSAVTELTSQFTDAVVNQHQPREPATNLLSPDYL